MSRYNTPRDEWPTAEEAAQEQRDLGPRPQRTYPNTDPWQAAAAQSQEA